MRGEAPAGSGRAPVYRRNPRVVSRALAEEAGLLLLHLDTDAYHRLNATGARLWDALERPATAERAARRLAKRTGEDAAALMTDVETYLSELASRALVLAEEGGSSP